MPGARIRCGNCSNSKAEYLRVTPDSRFLYCRICGSYTSLFDYSVYHEIDGIRGLAARLQNGTTLIELEKYREAETEFRSLTNEYSSSSETWFGLARAVSRDFTSLNRQAETLKLLENAEKVARQGEAAGGSGSAAAYYARLRKTLEEREKAHSMVGDCERKYQSALGSLRTESYQQKKAALENCRKNVAGQQSFAPVLLFGILFVAAAVCWRGASSVGQEVTKLVQRLIGQGYSATEIEQYIAQQTHLVQQVNTYYIWRIVTTVAALVTVPFACRSARHSMARSDNMKKLRKLEREIAQLEPLVESELRECKLAAEEAKNKLAQHEKELERLKAAHAQERRDGAC